MDGPFRFSLVTADWEVSYSADFGPGGAWYRAESEDAHVCPRSARDTGAPRADWLNDNKPTLFLSGDRMLSLRDVGSEGDAPA
ncbi:MULTISPECIES: hypothetical protein [unclassified Amycolatopsis]|uniref:hypothetical protein n=1 Tax=unclassified Amycolatopsis TaxID=2618356 RepID=UPI001C69D0EC|nr:hypothetical protein [Amycolatopsis sp. DSM 110486]QYN21478.1 hypothetical protein K1T34_02695 [Amycolatopsis sp. DSM 110486]